MHILVCPGFHPPALTESFITGLRANLKNLPTPQLHFLVFPSERQPAYSGRHIIEFLEQNLSPNSINCPETPFKAPILLVGFSAGVVGALTAAWQWRRLGRPIKALIAVDGWGVPLWGDFPIHRMSHDYFTHWSSGLLGTGEDSFYADPAVPHLALWQSPQTTDGWWVFPSAQRSPIPSTAANFISALIQRYSDPE